MGVKDGDGRFSEKKERDKKKGDPTREEKEMGRRGTEVGKMA